MQEDKEVKEAKGKGNGGRQRKGMREVGMGRLLNKRNV